LVLLALPMVLLMAASAGYSAFLFGQAEGRDFWQSPLVLPHLLLGAATAGAATLLLAAVFLTGDARVAQWLSGLLWLLLVGGGPPCPAGRPAPRRRATTPPVPRACSRGAPIATASGGASWERGPSCPSCSSRARSFLQARSWLPSLLCSASGSGKTCGCARGRRCRSRENAMTDLATGSTAEPLHPHARDLDPPASGLNRYPPVDPWSDWGELDSRAWPRRVSRRYSLVPTICFNCEAGCGLLAYVDKQTLRIQKFEGNPEHPGSRGRNCAKGPATLNQVQDPERILYPLRRTGARGSGQWERVTWDEVLDDIGGRIRAALVEGRQKEIMYHLGRPGHELVYLQRVFHAWGIDGHNSHTNVCSASARAGYAFLPGFDRPPPDPRPPPLTPP